MNDEDELKPLVLDILKAETEPISFIYLEDILRLRGVKFTRDPLRSAVWQLACAKRIVIDHNYRLRIKQPVCQVVIE